MNAPTLRHGSPEEAGMDPERIRQIGRLAQSWIDDGTHPALVLLVARRGIVVLHDAWGTLTGEPGSAPTLPETIFPLYSISKPLCATCVMCLVEDGLLGLNRPVQEYIPEFVGAGKDAVMVHHLLTHTSGLEDQSLGAHVANKIETHVEPPLEIPTRVSIAPAVYILMRRFEASYDAPLVRPPGTTMTYCNANYVLLAEIVRRVSGRPLPEFARERLLRPLGMNDTYYEVPEDQWHRVVRRPAGAFGFPQMNQRERLPTNPGWNGASSTARDMATFGQAFLYAGAYGGARILSPASVAAMTRDQIPGVPAHHRGESFAEGSWGLGWNVLGTKRPERDGSLISARTVSHSGAGGVNLWIDPENDIVGVYFSVVRAMLPNGPYGWNLDLFQNAVMAAVLD